MLTVTIECLFAGLQPIRAPSSSFLFLLAHLSPHPGRGLDHPLRQDQIVICDAA